MSGTDSSFRHAEPCRVEVRGRSLLFFGGYDYLNLSHHPEVHKALADTLSAEGLNSRGSRATTGEHAVFAELESGLAEFTGHPAVAVMSTGYLANLALFRELLPPGSTVILESRAHPSIVDAAKLADLKTRWFAAGDLRSLSRILRDLPQGDKVLAAEGLRSADGALAPLKEYVAALKEGPGILVLDEAHSLGTAGEGGRGLASMVLEQNVSAVSTGSLAKSLGSFGGFIAGPSEIIKRVRNSDIYRGSSALPLPQTAAALKALNLLREHPQWHDDLLNNSRLLHSSLIEHGFDVSPDITPVIILKESDVKPETLIGALYENGIYPTFIRYPGGPAEGFFRFAVSRLHKIDEINRLLTVIISCRRQHD